MRRMVFSLLAAAALSVGAASKDPVKLTDVQLDKATAGAAAINPAVTAATTADLSRLQAMSNVARGRPNSVP